MRPPPHGPALARRPPLVPPARRPASCAWRHRHRRAASRPGPRHSPFGPRPGRGTRSEFSLLGFASYSPDALDTLKKKKIPRMPSLHTRGRHSGTEPASGDASLSCFDRALELYRRRIQWLGEDSRQVSHTEPQPVPSGSLPCPSEPATDGLPIAVAWTAGSRWLRPPIKVASAKKKGGEEIL